MKLPLFSEFAVPADTKTKDWRNLGARAVKVTLDRPDKPTLFSLPHSVARGEVGKALAKRPSPWPAPHDEFILDVQVRTAA